MKIGKTVKSINFIFVVYVIKMMDNPNTMLMLYVSVVIGISECEIFG